MMKISGLGPLQSVESVKSSSRPSGGSQVAASNNATTVSVSKDAAWVQSLRGQAQQMSPVRAQVVAETRAQLENGTFEASVDLDSLVDSLLADF
jgi:flagellar biosynthesis anti-sigma factor FlgM